MGKKQVEETTQLYDGEWHRTVGYTHHECCDCGLVHRVAFKLKDGELYEQWTVDKVETRKARRARKKG